MYQYLFLKSRYHEIYGYIIELYDYCIRLSVVLQEEL